MCTHRAVTWHFPLLHLTHFPVSVRLLSPTDCDHNCLSYSNKGTNWILHTPEWHTEKVLPSPITELIFSAWSFNLVFIQIKEVGYEFDLDCSPYHQTRYISILALTVRTLTLSCYHCKNKGKLNMYHRKGKCVCWLSTVWFWTPLKLLLLNWNLVIF